MLLNLASVVNADTPRTFSGASSAATMRTRRRRRCRSWPGWSATRSPTIATSCARRSGSARRTRPSARRWRTSPSALAALDAATPAEDIQNTVYDVGKRHPFAELRAWFACLYQVLLGQADGPRFGQFVALYGIAETVALIRTSLAHPADAA